MASSPRQSKPLLGDKSNQSIATFGAIDNIQDDDISIKTQSSIKKIKSNINNEDGTYSKPTFESIINETIYIVYGWILMAALFCFFDSCSWYVWILYARSLGETNHHRIAMSIYSCYFIQGFATLFWSRISDLFTYTRIAQLLCFLLSIAYFIQAWAQNFEQLLIGTGLLAICRGLFTCSTAFIARYLPLEYSIKYTSYLYSITTILYLSGPIAGGLIAFFINYRWCFIVSCGVSGFTFLFMMIMMNGRETRIKRKQIAFSIENPNMRFPVCITKNKKQRGKRSKPNMKRNRNRAGSFGINGDYNHKETFWSSISPSNWFLLFCIVFANASLYAVEAILSTFYTVFCTDLYPNNKHIIIIATCQVALYCFFFIVGVRIVPKLLKCKCKNKKNFNFEHEILIFTQCIMVVAYGYLWSIATLDLYWALSAVGGLIMGTVNMVRESILLTLQPNNYAGTVAGLKQFGRCMFLIFANKSFATIYIYIYRHNEGIWMFGGWFVMEY